MTLDHPWTEPPAPADIRAVAPGIHWLRMPLPFQLNHINLWLLEDGDGWTIVDTGVGLDDTRALWERIFATHLGGRPVRRVLVTHFHPDHMGNAGWLTARWKTELWCTQAEWLYAQFAWRSRGAADFEPRLAHFRRHGCGPEALVQLGRRGNHYPSLVPEVATEFRRIREGDAITIGRRTFRVLDRARPCARARMPLGRGRARPDRRRSGAAEDHDQRQRLVRAARAQPATPLSRLA